MVYPDLGSEPKFLVINGAFAGTTKFVDAYGDGKEVGKYWKPTSSLAGTFGVPADATTWNFQASAVPPITVTIGVSVHNVTVGLSGSVEYDPSKAEGSRVALSGGPAINADLKLTAGAGVGVTVCNASLQVVGTMTFGANTVFVNNEVNQAIEGETTVAIGTTTVQLQGQVKIVGVDACLDIGRPLTFQGVYWNKNTSPAIPNFTIYDYGNS